MASKLIQINKDGCPLASCKIGTFSLEVGEEVKITLNGKNPDWPAFIVGEVVAVDPYTKGSGWSYTVDIEEDDLNGGPMFEDCDIEVACYSCCDKNAEDIAALRDLIVPDTNTTYTYSGNGIFVPSDGGPNLDASDLLDDTDEVIDTSQTYNVVGGVLTVPTVDVDGNPTGNSLIVNVPDTFATLVDAGDGTSDFTNADGTAGPSVVNAPPSGAGSVGNVFVANATGGGSWGPNCADSIKVVTLQQIAPVGSDVIVIPGAALLPTSTIVSAEVVSNAFAMLNQKNDGTFKCSRNFVFNDLVVIKYISNC